MGVPHLLRAIPGREPSKTPKVPKTSLFGDSPILSMDKTGETQRERERSTLGFALRRGNSLHTS